MHIPRLVVERFASPGWRVDAQCRSKNAVYFFPPPHFERKGEKDAREGAARALCGSCKVRAECLDYALAAHEPHGIWGGLNELERRRLVRKRDAEAGSAKA